LNVPCQVTLIDWIEGSTTTTTWSVRDHTIQKMIRAPIVEY